MRQNMHDFIAISNKIEHSDIFFTMTCNSQWPEIEKSFYCPIRELLTDQILLHTSFYQTTGVDGFCHQ